MDRKLPPHLVWLFALVAVGGGLAISYVTAPMGLKVSAIAFAVFFGAVACAAAFLTRATAAQAIVPFVVASLGIGAIYFVVTRKVITETADAFGAGGAVDGFGSATAIVVAAIVLCDALVASIGGAIFGLKLRKVKSPRELLRRAA
jgi:hypothetical protein